MLTVKAINSTPTWKKKYMRNTGISKYLLNITINVNGLNSQIKRHKLSDWNKKQDLTICCLQEIHFTIKNTHKVEITG
jgi:hypothetical protein